MEITEFMFCIITGISVEVGGKLGSDYTKVAIKTFATNYKIKGKVINVAFSTKPKENIGLACLNDDRKSQEIMLESYGYEILESREHALKLLSDHFKEILGEEWKIIDGQFLSPDDKRGFMGNFLLTDYSLGPRRYSDSTKFFTDALLVYLDRPNLIDQFGRPMTFHSCGFKMYIKDPIRHCSDMVRNHDWCRRFR